MTLRKRTSTRTNHSQERQAKTRFLQRDPLLRPPLLRLRVARDRSLATAEFAHALIQDVDPKLALAFFAQREFDRDLGFTGFQRTSHYADPSPRAFVKAMVGSAVQEMARYVAAAIATQ